MLNENQIETLKEFIALDEKNPAAVDLCSALISLLEAESLTTVMTTEFKDSIEEELSQHLEYYESCYEINETEETIVKKSLMEI